MQDTKASRFDRRKERTRAALKGAAQELILKQGFDHVSVDDIVRRADVARGTFYLHYQDKGELVWDIVKAGMQEMDARLNLQFPGDSLSLDVQGIGFTAWFEHAQQHRELFRLILGPQGSAAIAHRFLQHLAEEVEREIRTGRVNPGIDVPQQVLAQFLAGALLRLVIWWIDFGKDFTPAEMGNLTLEMIYGRRNFELAVRRGAKARSPKRKLKKREPR
jgi:AcrR family transcriptional regulator